MLAFACVLYDPYGEIRIDKILGYTEIIVKKINLFILVGFQSFALMGASLMTTACGTVKGAADDIQVVGKNIGAVATGDVVPPFDEEGNPQFSIGEMPKGYHENADHFSNAVNRNGVRLYDQETGFDGNHANSLPSLSGGINAGSNSNVTIFPLNDDMRNTFEGRAPSYKGYAAPQGFVPIESGFNNSDAQIYFNHGSSRLGRGDIRKLSAVAQKSGAVKVEGYASKPTQAGAQSVKASILNLKESMNRSFAVSSALLKKGVPAGNITTVSHGSGKATGNPSQDRRVDVTAGY